jgi:PKD repeat protein
MKKILLATAAFAVMFATNVSAQNTSCGTHTNYIKQLQKSPASVDPQQQFENLVSDYTANNPTGEKAVRIIPVVFHVLHEGGPENISKAQIEDQIDLLNADFRRLNADTGNTPAPFKAVAADCNIEFRLANKDPQGNCTDGIVRIYSSKTNNASDDNGAKGVSYWPRNQYLNVWVVKSIDSGDLSGGFVLGYAQLPYFGGAATDGIVVRHDYIGSIGTAVSPAGGSNGKGRTVTHEVGHWLGLRHIWGDQTCGSDGVGDTPVHREANSGCPAFPKTNTCSNPGANGEMFTNYMDYTNGSCQNIFTVGQKAIMDATLTSITVRKNLIQTANLNATGVNNNPPNVCSPIADFAADEFMICKGSSVGFNDGSWNGSPTQWDWSFAGGTPSSSTAQNPTVTYNTPGIYDVTLTVTNSQGTSSKTKQAIVKVSDTNAEDINYNFVDGFEQENEPFADRWITVNSGGGDFKWSRFAGAGFNTWYSAKMANFGNGSGDVDELISPSFKLNNISSPVLKFKVSYATTSSSSTDVLKVFLSVDCGKTWTVRYSKTGTALSTSSNTGSPFTPTNTNQWREETVSIPSSIANKPNVRLKFAFTSGGGNNLYLDDINISNPTGNIDLAVADNLGLTVFPNPSAGDITFYFNLLAKAKTDIRLYDVVGKEILPVFTGNLQSGYNQFTVNRAQVPSAGVYLLQVMVDGNRFTKRIIFTE